MTPRASALHDIPSHPMFALASAKTRATVARPRAPRPIASRARRATPSSTTRACQYESDAWVPPSASGECVGDWCEVDDADAMVFAGINRRDAMVAAGAIAANALLYAWFAPDAPAKSPAASKASSSSSDPESSFASLRSDVVGLMKKDADFGPTMVRLAWHSSGTYDKMTKTGGNGGGTIRFKEELAHGGNAGLDKAVKRLEPIKKRHPDVRRVPIYTGPHTTAFAW